jgi:exonuclease SbcC
MLRVLTIRNAPRHPFRKIDFQKGLTAISGPNESGKSVLLEMIRYALWGSEALRGTSEDYKKLEVTLDFDVREIEYRVERIRNSATLSRDGAVVATGIKAVNAKIIEIFGYNMAVFDVANACLQGQVEALGKMRPSERQKMVDQTVGLTFIDTLIKWVGDQASAINHEATALASVAVQPNQPTKPGDYNPSHQLDASVAKLRALAAERSELIGWLSRPLTPPADPGPRPSDWTLEDFEKRRDARAKVLDLISSFQGEIKRNGVELEWRQKTYRQHEATQKSLRERITNAVVAPYTEAELVDMEVALERHAAWCAKQRLLARGSLTCPSCSHSWPIASHELGKYKDVTEVPAPAFQSADIKKWRTLLNNQVDVAFLQQEIEKLETPKAELQLEIESIAATIETIRAQEVVAIKQLAELVDMSSQETSLRRWMAQSEVYVERLSQFEALQNERALKQARLDELHTVPTDLALLETKSVEARAYESQLATFEELSQRYRDTAAKALETKARADQMTAARDALKEMKLHIKQHLVPSLSVVASRLLQQMTGGARTTIAIDEEFNIKVDNQNLNTLSGSGQAVANLAIRIGLGQVLTNKVFSVFMADEIDAAMDSERATYTAECLANLNTSISQILLISHKRLDATHHIELTR